MMPTTTLITSFSAVLIVLAAAAPVETTSSADVRSTVTVTELIYSHTGMQTFSLDFGYHNHHPTSSAEFSPLPMVTEAPAEIEPRALYRHHFHYLEVISDSSAATTSIRNVSTTSSTPMATATEAPAKIEPRIFPWIYRHHLHNSEASAAHSRAMTHAHNASTASSITYLTQNFTLAPTTITAATVTSTWTETTITATSVPETDEWSPPGLPTPTK